VGGQRGGQRVELRAAGGGLRAAGGGRAAVERGALHPDVAAALGHPAADRARAQLAQELVQAGALAADHGRGDAGEGGEVAGAQQHRAAPVHRQPAGRGGERVAGLPGWSGTAASAAWVGVEQQTAATSSMSVRSV
jgi:hypothetical protein